MPLRGCLAVLFLAGVALPGVAADKKRGLEILWTDTEGGAATLIVTPAGESILIDCGNPGNRDAERIFETARKAGLKRIDHLIVTHWHSDHYGGAGRLAKLIPIGKFYDRGVPAAFDEDKTNFPVLIRAYKAAGGDKSTTLKAGDKIPLKQVAGAPKVELLCVCAGGEPIAAPADARDNPLPEGYKPHPDDPSDNAKSLAFVLTFGGWRFFDAGDLTWNVEAKLASPKDRVGKVDVYQVTHHGLEISNNPLLIRTLDPRVAVCNNGPGKGGHPSVIATLRRLPDMRGLFQLHRNLRSEDTDNTTPDKIANDGRKKEAGAGIRLVVEPDAKAYTVTVGRTGKAFRYETRK